MPKLIDPKDKRLPISVAIRHITEYSDHGFIDITAYIDSLLITINKLQGATEIYKKEAQDANQKLEDIIGALLIIKNASVCTAESCTGGYLSHLITSCPGSSEYYKGSVIAYSNEVKTNLLKIDKTIIDTKGAVSEEVVIAMAVNARNIFKTTYSIATTGVAGPGGGSAAKPVGTVWIAVASPNNVTAHKFLFGENRSVNISRSAITALNMLRKELLKN